MSDSISSGKKDSIHLGSAQNKAIHAKEGSSKPAIEYYKKNVYGNEHNYIHNPDIAAAHKQLTGQTTLGNNHIAAYKALGHDVNHVPKN